MPEELLGLRRSKNCLGEAGRKTAWVLAVTDNTPRRPEEVSSIGFMYALPGLVSVHRCFGTQLNLIIFSHP